MYKSFLIVLGIVALILLGASIYNQPKSKNFGDKPSSFSYPQNEQHSQTITTYITTEEYTPADSPQDYARQPFSVYTNQSPVYTPNTSPTNNSPKNCPSSQTQAMWAWDSTVVTDSSNNYEKRNDLFQFASDKNINTIYIESYGIITGSSTTNKTALADFIRLANDTCISVELLAGESEWYLPSNHSSATNFTQKVVDFADSFSVKPKAIHLDIEPYGYSSGSLWNANNGANRGAILSDYISMLSKVKSTLPNNILLNVDVPFWYDSASELQGSGALYFSHEIMKTVDIMTIMDYRDTAFGVDSSGNLIASKGASTNGIYDLGYDEVAYANTLGKKVVIGVETKCFSDSGSAQITFCGTRTVGGKTIKKGSSFMKTELEKVRDAFSSLASFKGTAIHHYGSYKILPNSY